MLLCVLIGMVHSELGSAGKSYSPIIGKHQVHITFLGLKDARRKLKSDWSVLAADPRLVAGFLVIDNLDADAIWSDGSSDHAYGKGLPRPPTKSVIAVPYAFDPRRRNRILLVDTPRKKTEHVQVTLPFAPGMRLHGFEPRTLRLRDVLVEASALVSDYGTVRLSFKVIEKGRWPIQFYYWKEGRESESSPFYDELDIRLTQTWQVEFAGSMVQIGAGKDALPFRFTLEPKAN